jgi:hypothetical protein
MARSAARSGYPNSGLIIRGNRMRLLALAGSKQPQFGSAGEHRLDGLPASGNDDYGACRVVRDLGGNRAEHKRGKSADATSTDHDEVAFA